MKGAGKRVVVYIPEMQEAELMYKLFDLISGDIKEVLEFLKADDAFGCTPADI